jgi:hypothetical protein
MKKLICIIMLALAIPVARAEARLTPAQVANRSAIIKVWGRAGRASIGLKIAWCESHWYTTAKNGSHLGLFQMGASERRKFGHGPSPFTQARAALSYYWVSGLSPWYASQSCWS